MKSSEKLERWKKLAKKRAELLTAAYAALAEMNACVDALVEDHRAYADNCVAARNGQEAHKEAIARSISGFRYRSNNPVSNDTTKSP